MRRHVILGAVLLAVLLACGIALAARGYPDRRGDVAGGAGPDLVSIQLSDTPTSVTFTVRFAAAPPLGFNAREKWVDMLLIGIDVPPLGAPPAKPGGEWPGANLALGTHGPSKSGMIVRLGTGIPADARQVGTFRIVSRGATLTFSIPRRVLGGAKWFAFSVAAARETEEPDGGGVDLAPARGTFRYALS